MVTRKTKFSISIEKLQIEFEGSQELGQQIHQGVTQAIGGLMNAQARLLSVRGDSPRVVDATVLDGTASQDNGQAMVGSSGDGNSEKSKQPRPRRAKGAQAYSTC